MRTGSARAAISGPTISSQWVTISHDVKPWRANTSATHMDTSSASGFGEKRLFIAAGSATTVGHDTTRPNQRQERPHTPDARQFPEFFASRRVWLLSIETGCCRFRSPDPVAEIHEHAVFAGGGSGWWRAGRSVSGTAPGRARHPGRLPARGNR